MIAATLSKAYGACVSLAEASVAIAPGTVHAIVGENGAGKSTLVKILAGVIRADRGTLRVGERDVEVAVWDRRAARRAGIGIVQQHGASAGTLTVVENAVLGAEPAILRLDEPAAALRKLGDELGLPIDPHARVDALSLGAAQRAEIVAALWQGAKLLLLDEPTAVLAPVEVEGLLARLRALAKAGTTIAIVTHKLDEVKAVADAVTVLRQGKTVATFDSASDTHAIARAMVGAELPPVRVSAAPRDDVTLAIDVGGVALEVKAGEIVGIAGVDGNGQRELALAIAGLLPSPGKVVVGGVDVSRASPGARLAAGLAHVPEDRQHGGLILDATVAEGLALGRRDLTGRFVIDRARVAAHAAAQIALLDIRPPDAGARVASLSGGNQQKVVIGRELSRPALRAVLACQPTRGVDLGAVARIHDRLRAAAEQGAGVLVISADLDELLALCHRVVVMLRGEIVGSARDREALGALMTGAA